MTLLFIIYSIDTGPIDQLLILLLTIHYYCVYSIIDIIIIGLFIHIILPVFSNDCLNLFSDTWPQLFIWYYSIIITIIIDVNYFDYSVLNYSIIFYILWPDGIIVKVTLFDLIIIIYY